MDNGKRELRGSRSRDLFKYLHKQMMSRNCYALNSDLELVEKYPTPFTVARLDFKTLGDRITFTEAIAYNEYSTKLAPVYIVEVQARPVAFETIEPEDHRFNVYRFISADPRPEPPTVERDPIASNLTWQELAQWEERMRAERKREMRRNGIEEQQASSPPEPPFEWPF